MLAYIEALAAVESAGTMTRAATQLRITQSAVSKRIAALEAQVGHKLIEKAGRRVRLTPFGVALLARMNPLLYAFKEALLDQVAVPGGRIVLGMSESILSSWGAPLLAKLTAANPHLDLVLNAHRSPVAIERVRSGEYMLALCAGRTGDTPDLKAEHLLEEPMVLVPSGLHPFTIEPGAVLPVLTIERHSATWSSLERRLQKSHRPRRFKLVVEQTVQSFTCIVQMARHGLGHGLVPKGLAHSMGVPADTCIDLPAPGLTRPVNLVGRPTTFALPLVAAFHRQLRQHLEDISL
ncbi:MAG: LysR family transcriptional regulator [Candidatus Latescibacteria bacterium]|nr:LysR family transcriptional regulator [Candidatus Latescibacterota bacterium]